MLGMTLLNFLRFIRVSQEICAKFLFLSIHFRLNHSASDVITDQIIQKCFYIFVDKNTGSKSNEIKGETNSRGIVKKKRNRSHFTQMQLKYLEDVFSRQQYLTRDERALLANALDMTELQIRNWFQNRRYQIRHRGLNRARQVPVKVLVSSNSAHPSED